MRRVLPVYVERDVQRSHVERVELADTFERSLLSANRPITCREGCSNCCSHPLLISILEGIQLYRSLVSHGHWVPSFRKKLESSSEMTNNLTFQVWLFSNIPCPLLDGNQQCMAYQARPFTCRLTMATGNAYFCHPQRIGDETTIVPRLTETQEFHAREAELLRKHGLRHLLFPVGRAILLAERVCTGDIMFEDVDRVYIDEHKGR